MSILDLINPAAGSAGSVPLGTVAVLPDLLKDLVVTLKGIHELLIALDPVETLKILKELAKVIVPLSCIIPLLKKISEAYEDLENTDVEQVIQGPNLDTDTAHELARLFAVPYVGDLVRNQINLAWMDRYQKSTGRGFPTALDQLHYFANGGISSSSVMADVTSAIPRFFMDNKHSSPDKFNKGYKAALAEKRTHRPRP